MENQSVNASQIALLRALGRKLENHTHFPAEMVLNRLYSPPDDLKDLYDFTRTKYCLNR